MKGAFRSIGINRNDFVAVLQLRPDMEKDCSAVEWIAYASNAFNTLAPFYPMVDATPEYLSNTTGDASTENFYWMSRMIAAMTDASYGKSLFHAERYQESVMAKSHQILNCYDEQLAKESDSTKRQELRQKANEEIAAMLKKEATDTLNKVLYELSNQMKNAYSRSDS